MKWQHRFRILSIAALTLLVSGCGFQDVTSLQSNLPKTGVLLVGTKALLAVPTLSQSLSTLPSGISLIQQQFPQSQKTITKTIQMDAPSDVILLGTDSAYLDALAQQFPSVHFIVFMPSTNRFASYSNITNIAVKYDLNSAFLAGYVAGTLGSTGKLIPIIATSNSAISGGSPSLIALSSGVYAAFSSDQVLVDRITNHDTLAMPLSTSQDQAVIVLGDVSTAINSAILQSKVPIIDLTGLMATSTPSMMASLAVQSALASGMSQIFRYIATGQSLPSTQYVIVSTVDVSKQYTGWLGIKGFTTFTQKISNLQNNAIPQLSGVWTTTQAKLSGFPIPAKTVTGITYLKHSTTTSTILPSNSSLSSTNTSKGKKG